MFQHDGQMFVAAFTREIPDYGDPTTNNAEYTFAHIKRFIHQSFGESCPGYNGGGLIDNIDNILGPFYLLSSRTLHKVVNIHTYGTYLLQEKMTQIGTSIFSKFYELC